MVVAFRTNPLHTLVLWGVERRSRYTTPEMNLSALYRSVMEKLNEICLVSWNIRRSEKDIERKLDKVLQMQQQLQVTSDQNALALAKIILFLQPPPPVKFLITFIGENAMGKAVKATVDFQMLDNGSATATLTPVDTVGNTTTLPSDASVPVWASSDPSVVVTPAADGMSAALAPSGSLATGVLVSASSTLADSTVITGQGDPIDVVAGPAASFKIVEA